MFTNIRETWAVLRGGAVISIRFTKVGGSRLSPAYTYRLYCNRVLVEEGRVARHRQSAGWRALLRAVIRGKGGRCSPIQRQLEKQCTPQHKEETP